jgi:hypothetical protein
MKYKIAIGAILFTAVSVVPALADVYVAVDQNGNAVGQAIICDAQTCAKGSLFSQMTLPIGAHYALQGVGIGYGQGAGQGAGKVSVDENTNVWTVNQTDTNKDKLTGAITQVNTVQTFTPTNPTRVVVSQSVTPIAPPTVVTPSVTTTDTNSVLNQLLTLLQSLIAQLGGR